MGRAMARGYAMISSTMYQPRCTALQESCRQFRLAAEIADGEGRTLD
jgi:hypothetical protein